LCGECSELLNCDRDPTTYGHKGGLCWTDSDEEYEEDLDDEEDDGIILNQQKGDGGKL
jgi:hypothetical protein